MNLDSYSTPDAEARLLAAEERFTRRQSKRRELITNCAGAAAFLITAISIAVIAPWSRPLSVENLAIVLVVWLLIERVKFPVAQGWTHPTMLAFVPALFLLPTPIVPLVAMVVTVLRRAPELARGRVQGALVPMLIADAWYSVGPVLVLVLADAQIFAWSNWPVYVVALLAQFLLDMAASLTWAYLGEGISPRVQLPLLSWLYVTDALLAPIGLLIASVAVVNPPMMLLAASPLALLWLFARERKERLDETLALSTAYRGTAMLLGDVVEYDHEYTGAHSRDVVDLSLAVADHLGLGASERRNVEFAALLHDVGKIHVPKEIINKPGKLDEEEWAIMRGHTIEGERMLKQVGGLLANVGRIVRASHEHYDGRGYPDGLVGDAIPIEARIVSTCDAYSAMTTDRSYRQAMPKRDALAELHRCSGSQFDPQVVAAIELLEGAAETERLEWLEFLGTGGKGSLAPVHRLTKRGAVPRTNPAPAPVEGRPAAPSSRPVKAVHEVLK